MTTIEEAIQMRNKIDVEAQVTGAKDERAVNLKDGSTTRVRDVTIKDDSGEMPLTLWGDDIDRVKVGDTVRVGNGYTNAFKGNISLAKGKYGTLEVV